MTGGGFGGCALALCEPRAKDELIQHVTGAYRARCGRDCSAFEVQPASGAIALPIA
jgi:galactokinase